MTLIFRDFLDWWKLVWYEIYRTGFLKDDSLYEIVSFGNKSQLANTVADGVHYGQRHYRCLGPFNNDKET